jgi:hypothetical protein
LHFRVQSPCGPEYPLGSTLFSTRASGFSCHDAGKLFHRLPSAGYIWPQVRLPQNHKLLAFLPLVFVIGTEGFAMFAPYVVFLLAVAHLARRLKSSASNPQAVPA